MGLKAPTVAVYVTQGPAASCKAATRAWLAGATEATSFTKPSRDVWMIADSMGCAASSSADNTCSVVVCEYSPAAWEDAVTSSAMARKLLNQEDSSADEESSEVGAAELLLCHWQGRIVFDQSVPTPRQIMLFCDAVNRPPAISGKH
jgi:hypothetical protein